MSHSDSLLAWLKTNRPDLFEQVRAAGVASTKALNILNRETGVGVQMLDRVEDGCCRFLEALKAMPAAEIPSTSQG